MSDMSTRESRPDALIIGAPKAGTSALHAALARHPQVYASPVKEPKYYLCGDAPPPAYCGPGDAHSQQEWIWRRADYAALFAAAPADAVRLESTPFYLYLAGRPAADRRGPARRASWWSIVRDPVDRAYSNWMHLWVDGLEPDRPTSSTRGSAEDARVDAGWAPFWHYRRMGRYGEQLADLFTRVDRDRVLVLRYWRAGVRAGRDPEPGRDAFSASPRTRSARCRRTTRARSSSRARRRPCSAGRCAPVRPPGSYFRPRSGGRRVKPLLPPCSTADRSSGPSWRPRQRAELVEDCLDDIGLLEEVLGESFETGGRVTGARLFKERRERAPTRLSAVQARAERQQLVIRSWEPSARAASK